MDRFVRQQKLVSVGAAGQARIVAATYQVSSSAPRAGLQLGLAELAAAVEREYLERAGAQHFVSRQETSPAFAHAGAFQHDAARALGAGAWRALIQLRAALADASRPPAWETEP